MKTDATETQSRARVDRRQQRAMLNASVKVVTSVHSGPNRDQRRARARNVETPLGTGTPGAFGNVPGTMRPRYVAATSNRAAGLNHARMMRRTVRRARGGT